MTGDIAMPRQTSSGGVTAPLRAPELTRQLGQEVSPLKHHLSARKRRQKRSKGNDVSRIKSLGCGPGSAGSLGICSRVDQERRRQQNACHFDVTQWAKLK
jgi:hypothetical protein